MSDGKSEARVLLSFGAYKVALFAVATALIISDARVLGIAAGWLLGDLVYYAVRYAGR